jgi:hypothetical protein
MGHEDAFPPHRLNAGYAIGKETLAGTRGNGRDAPVPAFAASWPTGSNRPFGDIRNRYLIEILLAQILDAGVSPRTKFGASETNRSRTSRPHCSGMPALRSPAK